MTLDERLALLDLPETITSRWNAQLREPHRHYHTLDHVEAMLGRDDGADVGVIAAIWLHDIVYDPSASDNEERSADQARADLPPGASADLAVRLILDTRHHTRGDSDTDAFNNLDLAIIGTSVEVYDRHAAQSAANMTSCPMWRIAPVTRHSSAFAKRRIFRTAEFQPIEHEAQANRQREIGHLDEGA